MRLLTRHPRPRRRGDIFSELESVLAPLLLVVPGIAGEAGWSDSGCGCAHACCGACGGCVQGCCDDCGSPHEGGGMVALPSIGIDCCWGGIVDCGAAAQGCCSGG